MSKSFISTLAITTFLVFTSSPEALAARHSGQLYLKNTSASTVYVMLLDSDGDKERKKLSPGHDTVLRGLGISNSILPPRSKTLSGEVQDAGGKKLRDISVKFTASTLYSAAGVVFDCGQNSPCFQAISLDFLADDDDTDADFDDTDADVGDSDDGEPVEENDPTADVDESDFDEGERGDIQRIYSQVFTAEPADGDFDTTVRILADEFGFPKVEEAHWSWSGHRQRTDGEKRSLAAAALDVKARALIDSYRAKGVKITFHHSEVIRFVTDHQETKKDWQGRRKSKARGRGWGHVYFTQD